MDCLQEQITYLDSVGNIGKTVAVLTDVKHGIFRDEAICPYCKKRNKSPLRPTLKINKRNNEWFCFGCKQGGGVSDVFQKLEDFSLEDSLRKAANINNVDLDANFRNSPTQQQETISAPSICLSPKAAITRSIV